MRRKKPDMPAPPTTAPTPKPTNESIWAKVGTDEAVDAFAQKIQDEANAEWLALPSVSLWLGPCRKCGLLKDRQHPKLERMGRGMVYIGAQQGSDGQAELYETSLQSRSRYGYGGYSDDPPRAVQRRVLTTREVIEVTCECGFTARFRTADAVALT